MNEACLKFVDCHVSPSELPVLVSTVQRALASYDFLHAEKAKGNVLVVKAPGGSEKEVVLL
jgi:hypothetical protein